MYAPLFGVENRAGRNPAGRDGEWRFLSRGLAGEEVVNILTFAGGQRRWPEGFSTSGVSRSLRCAHPRVTEGAVNYE